MTHRLSSRTRCTPPLQAVHRTARPSSRHDSRMASPYRVPVRLPAPAIPWPWIWRIIRQHAR
jgi:hypothetical protein